MRSDNSERKKAISSTSVVVASVLLVILSIGYCSFTFLTSTHSPPPEFCTLNDEVYQTIVANVEEWITSYHIPNLPTDRELSFQVPSGRVYVVSADTWDIWNNEPPRLFVVREHGWNERMGLNGYIYSLAGETSFDKYSVEYLAEDVYCYQRMNILGTPDD
jgi:hypothetical protein